MIGVAVIDLPSHLLTNELKSTFLKNILTEVSQLKLKEFCFSDL